MTKTLKLKATDPAADEAVVETPASESEIVPASMLAMLKPQILRFNANEIQSHYTPTVLNWLEESSLHLTRKCPKPLSCYLTTILA